ncbi:MULTISPECIES: DUF4133 domain-containing protein [unclassified Flavobacterium]|uniref:DUF4133 domain-containing protein n=1 Tax=unclassified Flavobacterium TaxID=196869 RepID=UPI00095BA6AF|nr:MULTISPECIES: DUF4133 domain-containing protein [unclassified Flavobacterium]MBN9284119.1 DUF4133 domain-containing protein [Flavobacterium sp.]OJV71133.1 MAG: hypothetical protein BGO42_04795 [Flavobacterium sp. 40-81]
MANSVYKINKGINQSIEFKGLKAQYIWYLGAGVVGLLIVYSVMYIIGLPTLVCLGVIGISGTLVFMKVYRMSNMYGEYGLMKELARRQIPKNIKCNSRKVYRGF